MLQFLNLEHSYCFITLLVVPYWWKNYPYGVAGNDVTVDNISHYELDTCSLAQIKIYFGLCVAFIVV